MQEVRNRHAHDCQRDTLGKTMAVTGVLFRPDCMDARPRRVRLGTIGRSRFIRDRVVHSRQLTSRMNLRGCCG